MRMTHRLTALFLALLLVLTALPAAAFAEEEEMFSEGFGAAPETPAPTVVPTTEPVVEPTAEPTSEPTVSPTAEPTVAPTAAPTAEPTIAPTAAPTAEQVAEKAAFVAGLARVSSGVRLYEHKGLWGAYVETVSGGVVYASEQSDDEKAIRIVLNNGVSLWEGWVKTEAVRMMSADAVSAWDSEDRSQVEGLRTYRGHDLLVISTVSSEPTPVPETTPAPDEDFTFVVPMLTPEPEADVPQAPATQAPTQAPIDVPAEEDADVAVEEELFGAAPVEATSAPISDPVIDEDEDENLGKLVEYRALSAPTNLSASHNRNGLMTLRWQGTANANAYQVLYKTDPSANYSVLATVYGTSYTTDKLDPTVVYYFRVQAMTLSSTGTLLNASPHSATYPYIVLGDAKINDPRGKDTSTIRLTWTAVTGATHYDVMMSVHGANSWSIIRTDLVTDYCDVKDLSFDETYDFRVIPKRKLSNGTVITGNSSRVIMVGSPMETPSFQQYDWTENGLKLTWDAIPGASGYVIYRRAFSDPDVTNYKKLVVLDTPVTTYTDTTMEPGEVYYYFVYSFKLCSPEGWRCFSLKGNIGMGVWLPQADNLVATDYDATNVLLSWPAVTGASHYDVFATKGSSTLPGAASGTRITTTQVYHNTAVVGTTYYYFVRPVRIFSNGDVSMGPWSLRLTHLHDDPTITYRALLIGNTYTNESKYLPGCDNDAYAMRSMLSRMTATPYSTSVQLNLSDSGMINAIRTTFASADANDVSLFFFSGHGANSPDSAYHGALCGTQNTYLSVQRLKEELDAIPGKKIVLIDSCHSGQLIGKSSGEATVSNAELSAFNSLVVNAFASDENVIVKAADVPMLADEDEIFSASPMQTRGVNDLANSGYYVITAAHSTEQSVSMGYDSNSDNQAEKYFGLFTYALCYGNGWNLTTNTAINTLYADRDSNGEISLYEAYVYAKNKALSSNPNQNAQIWPANSAFVIWGR